MESSGEVRDMDNMDNVDNQREELIRRRAYVIWEHEGRPDGQHERHWEQAAREMQGSEPQGSEANGKAASGSGIRTNGSRRREKQTMAETEAPASPAEGSAAPRLDGER
ncbi:DUF2934 domain-containing protein [Sinorhizobium medicae]|nr:DUF2934 domain-containing protein [Sinorhizobium medicae]MDX0490380.1 DUF2934 domain-containing protein [Sinorhizobium medicae]MDX0871762.1 DUF2934 domain-containing protein [Sinorhizobium medicae]MDX0952062.1 DUF2934 domain-containing protein [Sinorhizobium medicae]MDX1035822.1 DUF2934 domain-containing protein [Sinorhizobium medicae]